MSEPLIKLYGTSWCYGSKVVRGYMDSHQIAYEWHDIDVDADSRAYVEQVNGGMRSVPTIVFPDGTTMVEPSVADLADKLDT